MCDVMPGAQHERSASIRGEHRLLGIDDEIQQHLLYLMRVGKHRRQPRCQRADDVDVGEPLLVGAQRQRFANHLIQIDHRTR